MSWIPHHFIHKILLALPIFITLLVSFFTCHIILRMNFLRIPSKRKQTPSMSIEKIFDLNQSILDQISQDFDNEINNLFRREQHEHDHFDDIIDNFQDKFLNTIKQCRNEKNDSTGQSDMKYCISGQQNLNISKHRQSHIFIVDTEDSIITNKDHASSESIGNVDNEQKGDSINNGLIDRIDSSKAGVEVNFTQLLDDFDEVFEPIHSDKVLTNP